LCPLLSCFLSGLSSERTALYAKDYANHGGEYRSNDEDPEENPFILHLLEYVG